MSTHHQPILDVKSVFTLLLHHPLRWIVPAVLIAVGAFVFALNTTKKWEATQALVIRDEAGAVATSRPGRFVNMEEMKTAQETVLEMAGSRAVAREALEQVGPSKSCKSPGQWPSAKDIETMQDLVSVSAPGGAEFGSTEVFYLTVKDKDPQRAVQLATSVCDSLEQRLQKIRTNRAKSLVGELSEKVVMVKDELDETTARITTIEKNVGPDLGELRILTESSGGESSLRTLMSQLRNERRQSELDLASNRRLLTLLENARKNPEQLIATPNRLLVSQPALRRLKEGLVDAQLKTSALKGVMSEVHPKVIESIASEAAIRKGLHDELGTAVLGLQLEIQVNQSKIADLTKRLDSTLQRISTLAGLRADYSNLLIESRQESDNLSQLSQELSEAKANLIAANSVSVVSRLDKPIVGHRPVGASRTLIAGGGLIGGLLVGFGIVFLTVPIQPAVISDESFQAVDETPVAHVAAPTEKSAAVEVESTNKEFSSDSYGKEKFTNERPLSLQQALRSIAEETQV